MLTGTEFFSGEPVFLQIPSHIDTMKWDREGYGKGNPSGMLL